MAGARPTRVMLDRVDVNDAGMARVCQAATKNNMPLNLLAWGRLDLAHKVAGIFAQVRQVGSIFGRDDDAEMVAIVAAAIRIMVSYAWAAK